MFRSSVKGVKHGSTDIGEAIRVEQRFKQPKIHEVSHSVVFLLAFAVIGIRTGMELLSHLIGDRKARDRGRVDTEPSEIDSFDDVVSIYARHRVHGYLNLHRRERLAFISELKVHAPRLVQKTGNFDLGRQVLTANIETIPRSPE